MEAPGTCQSDDQVVERGHCLSTGYESHHDVDKPSRVKCPKFMAGYAGETQTSEASCHKRLWAMDSPDAIEGMADVGGARCDSEAQAGTGSQGGWAMEEQGDGAGVGSLARAAPGAEAAQDPVIEGDAAVGRPSGRQGPGQVVGRGGAGAEGLEGSADVEAS